MIEFSDFINEVVGDFLGLGRKVSVMKSVSLCDKSQKRKGLRCGNVQSECNMLNYFQYASFHPKKYYIFPPIILPKPRLPNPILQSSDIPAQTPKSPTLPIQ